MSERPRATKIGDGVYRVDHPASPASPASPQSPPRPNGSDVVYVVRTSTGWWAFLDGQVFHGRDTAVASARKSKASGSAAAQALAAPMPATVLKVLVAAGDSVKKGDTVVVLEAMKMELPLRAAGDARVQAVHCREGELVQGEAVLVEFA